MNSIYVCVSVLQSFPPSNLNRDDLGRPKTATFGGVKRSRISSQSQKHAVREDFAKNSDPYFKGFRTKKTEECLKEKIIERSSQQGKKINEKEALKLAKWLLSKEGLGIVKPDPKKNSNEDEASISTTLYFTSNRELEQLADFAISNSGLEKSDFLEKARGNREQLAEIINSLLSPDIALFGRMCAGNNFMTSDACCQVAHAISTHRVETELDYFTAIDELEEGQGAGHVDTSEFCSSTMYRYAAVNFAALSKMIPEQAADTTVAFVRSFVKAIPQAKINAYGNSVVPFYVRIDIRTDMPVSYVGAFETPVVPAGGYDGEFGGYEENSQIKLEKYIDENVCKFADEPAASWTVDKKSEETFAEALNELENFLRESADEME